MIFHTFTLVAKMNIVRVLLSLVVSLNWLLQQFGVKKVFLHGDLEKEVHIDVSPGFTHKTGSNKVCQLKSPYMD